MGNCIVTKSSKQGFPDFNNIIYTYESFKGETTKIMQYTGWIFGFYHGYLSDRPYITLESSTETDFSQFPRDEGVTPVTRTMFWKPISTSSGFDYTESSFIKKVHKDYVLKFWGSTSMPWYVWVLAEK